MGVRSGGVVVAVIMLCAGMSGARGDEIPQGITVTGEGVASARAGIVEISATVSGEGELASDASVRYRDARRRVVEAIEELKIAGLSIESGGVTITQPPDVTAQQLQAAAAVPDPVRQKVAVTEQLRLVLKGAEEMETQKLLETLLRIVDTGRDNGMEIQVSADSSTVTGQMQAVIQGQNGVDSSLVTYRLADVAAVRDQAYRAAMEDARTKASRVAEVSGLKLGRVLAIREEQGLAMRVRADRDGESSLLGAIPVQVRLSVQFEIVR